MKAPRGALLGSGKDCGMLPAGTAIVLEEHRHYCSTCRSYWDHGDARCANLGRTMICATCAHQLLGGHAPMMLDSVTVPATDWSRNTEVLLVQKQ